MNTPKSTEGNILRLTVYFISYLLVTATEYFIINQINISSISILVFIIVSWIVLFFFINRYNSEQKYFDNSFKVPLLGKMPLIVGLTIAITAISILVSYLQTEGIISNYSLQTAYVVHESNRRFWFMIVVNGILLPVLQQYIATGFLFNYLFRGNSRNAAILGIITSALIYTILNFELSIPLALINFIFGIIIAWAFLYTQNLSMSFYLSILIGLLRIITL